MIRVVATLIAVSLAGCSSLGVTGTARPTDNVGLTLGTLLTPDGVSNSGSVSLRLF